MGEYRMNDVNLQEFLHSGMETESCHQILNC